MRFLLWLMVFSYAPAWGQALQMHFGAGGLDRLSWHGQVLADTVRWPEDRFHIWHMKCFEAGSGRPRTEGEYGWGENNHGRTWVTATKTWIYSFAWGSLRVEYVPHAEALEIRVTEVNRAGSGVVLDGASIYPVTLHVPGATLPDSIENGAEQPLAVSLRWPQGLATIVTSDAIYGGFQVVKEDTLAMLSSSTAPDALPEAARTSSSGVRPGATATYSISLRFSASAEPGDPPSAWVAQHPPTLAWTDRRILGTVYLASSGQGEKTHSAGFPTNPRRYFNDPGIDVTTPEGLRRFQKRVLDQAAVVVTNLRRMNAQGAITWDLEGEQYPQSTSYVCAPDQIGQVAPEMESVVGAGLPHAGLKLDDAYFRTIRDAGFRVGVCVRPQRFALAADGTARQQFLPVGEVGAELIRKMRYAHERWGATIFYLDSTVREGGWPLPSAVLEEAAHALPDSLLIPEEAFPRAYGSTAPFRTFLFHGDTGIPAAIRFFYPNAFAANLVNDVDPAKLDAHSKELVESIRRGDILMVHAGYWHPNNAVVMDIYREAARR